MSGSTPPTDSGAAPVRSSTASRWAAVVLAGGQSRRMGRDKALLSVGGRTLLEHQLDRLRALRPAELFVAARRAETYVSFGTSVLADRFPGQGPLAGIQRALEVMKAPLLLVLGVDLPAVEPEFLRYVLAAASPGQGVVPCDQDRIEPLVAVYPKEAESLARRRLESGQNHARAFVLECAQTGLVRLVQVPGKWASCFANWNRPEDMARTPADTGPR